MTTYIDPTTELPQNLGEIYSDRNIRIVGQARINPSNPNQIDTIGIQILCTPMAGGSEGVSSLADATYTLGGAGASLWMKITRSGTATVTPEIYAAGLQPKSRKDYVQVFYQTSSSQIVSISSFLVYPGPLYTRLGYGIGQRTYDAIVGDVGDSHATHTDLQAAINDVATNSWILVKKMCLVATTITTGGKSLKLQFRGFGTGLQASGATTGITFSASGCQLVGFGQITGFTVVGVNLNSQTGSRIEMVFSGNTANINSTGLNGTQYSFEGSYGLTETSHIQTSTSHGTVARWNNTTKRWEPVTGVTINDLGNTISTGTIQALQLRGSLTGAGTSVYLTATGMSTLQITHPSAGVARIEVNSGETLQIGDGTDTNISINGAGIVTINSTQASTSPTTGALVVTGGLGVSGTINGTTIAANVQSQVNRTSAGTSLYLTATGMSTLQISHPSAGVARLAVDAGQTLQIGDGSDTNLTISGAGIVTISSTQASTAYTNGALVVAGGVGIAGALNVNANITGVKVFNAVYNS